ncbi:hypothetical protein UFOVP446_17 [uncultured Caudovirales phage]|jgi:hypothetical protein|uniref:Tail completion protein n=1 Tax=uncultured Caudovirales phage TaxID=2100421 RepID=A0A6J5NRT9_9CAUD|nr:hypothetical protein UFOVP446_17 [uncultured Caudovirales phage]CAB4159875.1 hypothetical protein UFOVP725_6 [uncultured Caudovirales phage]
MPASTILSDVRTPLATALASVAGNVYSYVPETIIPPAVVVVPDTPYLELETISKSTLHVKINFTISVAVAYNSNPASLDNIEQLIMSVLAVIPTGYVVSVVERPTVTQVGASTLLIADVRVSTYYTQTT